MAERTSGLTGRTAKAAAVLRSEIEHGEFSSLERLPGERDLALHLSVSRTTLRRAIGALITDGLLYQRHGFGTYVHRHPVVSPAASPGGGRVMDVGPLLDGMAYFGGSHHFANVEDRVGLPSPTESLTFRLRANDLVWQRTRTVLVNDAAVAVESTIVPANFADAGLPHARLASVGIDTRGVPIGQALQRIRCVVLDQATKTTLGRHEETTGFSIERLLFLEDGRCCVVRRLLCRIDVVDCLQDLALERPTTLP